MYKYIFVVLLYMYIFLFIITFPSTREAHSKGVVIARYLQARKTLNLMGENGCA
jgi:hypothetical protein